MNPPYINNNPAPKKYDGQHSPLYDLKNGGHYGASAEIAAKGHAPPPETFTGHWANVSRVAIAADRRCYRWHTMYANAAARCLKG